MLKYLILFILFLTSQIISAQIKLTNNIGNTPIKTNIASCEYEEYWARTFNLSDFGISTSEQFIIESGEVALSNSYEGARILFNFYSIDSNFPDSSPKRLSYGNLVLAPYIGNTPEIVHIDFATPITIPAGVERILVEVTQMDDIYNPDYTEVLIAGSEQDKDISYFKGCREFYSYIPTENLSTPVPNANFFINVTGKKNSASSIGSTTTLSQNVCDELIKTSMFSCSYSKLYWARLFTLENFGVSTNEEFVINFGQIGISSSDSGTGIQFNIYEVDDNFPSSFSEANLIGSSQVQELPYISDYDPQIITVNFETPVTVPRNVKKILVEVTNIITWGSGVFFVAGTDQDVGDSWYKGCGTGSPGYSMQEYVTMVDPAFRKDGGYPDAKFYINVTGNVNNLINDFGMHVSNNCTEFLTEFSLTNPSEIASVSWDFGDPTTGTNNTSKDLSPFHDFSADGIFTITASIIGKNGKTEVLTETIEVKEPPTAYGINNLEACENTFGTGISNYFDTSNIQSQVLGDQSDKTVTYINGSGIEFDALPNPYTNSVRDRETIIVRVARNDELCCYAETSFDLIINPMPNTTNIEDLYVCDNNSDGFTVFDLRETKSIILENNTSIHVDFFHEDGEPIVSSQLNAVPNKVKDQETITVRLTNSDTKCYNESTFKIALSPIPTAGTLENLVGCDDNNDGISEYFDTSRIEELALGNQTGMKVSYFDSNKVELPNPLPNPYTNITPNRENISVRVTNPETGCFSETVLTLQTSSQPNINKPANKYACNVSNGIATFDTSTLKNELIGDQSGLSIFYFDEDGNEITNLSNNTYQNITPWQETIFIRVESESNSICYSETSLDLIVNELPEINLDNEYLLCNLEPFLYVATNSNFDTWKWIAEDGTVISNSFEANLIDAGAYTLLVSKNINGISCENTFSFNLVRSNLPSIEEVSIQDLSNNNYIEVITSGDGDFEYSIDGNNYQEENTFYNLSGGIYLVEVRDKKGCGSDQIEVVLVDFPKVFTPNNDGYNDHWQINGVKKFPNSKILIYDRYGKLLKELTSQSTGWDGTYNGNKMPAADYWFVVNLSDGRIFNGHFSLIRA